MAQKSAQFTTLLELGSNGVDVTPPGNKQLRFKSSPEYRLSTAMAMTVSVVQSIFLQKN